MRKLAVRNQRCRERAHGSEPVLFRCADLWGSSGCGSTCSVGDSEHGPSNGGQRPDHPEGLGQRHRRLPHPEPFEEGQQSVGGLDRLVLVDGVPRLRQEHHLESALHLADGQRLVQPVGAGEDEQLRAGELAVGADRRRGKGGPMSDRLRRCAAGRGLRALVPGGWELGVEPVSGRGAGGGRGQEKARR